MAVKPVTSPGARRRAARGRRVCQLMASLALIFLVVIGYLWLREPVATIVAQDFNHDYAGASLVHQGRAVHLYDVAAQTDAVRAATGSVPADYKSFSMLPTAAVLLSPLAALSFQTAFRVYVLINVALLILTATVVLRRLRPPIESGGLATLAALSSGGFAYMILWGQWDALTALLLAVAWVDLRNGDRLRAGVWLALAAGLGKPQLLIGLAVLVLASGRRRVVAGAVATAVGLAVADLLIVGPAGISQLLHISGQYNPVYGLVQMVGVGSLTASIFGDTPAASLAGTVVGVVVLGVCAGLGRRLAHHPAELDGLVAAGIALSLYASPHAFDYNLVLLSPAMAWMVAGRGARARDEGRPWPDLETVWLLGLWWTLAGVGFTEQVVFTPNLAFRVSPFLLLGLAGFFIRLAREDAGRGEPAIAASVV